MVDVHFALDHQRYRMTIRGHAEYNPGNDVVCAGISAIVFSLIGYLANAGDHIIVQDAMRYEPGRVDIDVSGDETLEPAFLMALIGIKQIEQAHPANVTVKIISES